jgi:DNA-binding XRE family transcriptional regulator
MTNKELQAIRKLLFLSTAEAAEHIGGVSARSWQHWESNKYPIPDDVSAKMNELIDRRLNIIETCEDLIHEHSDIDEITNQYYMTFESYKKQRHESCVIDWRISQSVAAYFFGERIAGIN